MFPTNKLQLRTPVHFGDISLQQAVALENINSHNPYDKYLVSFYNLLHAWNGNIHPELDFCNYVHPLAHNMNKDINPYSYARKVINHFLHETYAYVLLQNDMPEFTEELQNRDFSGYDQSNRELLDAILNHVNTTTFEGHLILWKKAITAIAEAEKAVAKAVKDKGDVEAVQAAHAARIQDFADIREAMIPIRKLEAVTRHLKNIWATPNDNPYDMLHIGFEALATSVRNYNNLFSAELNFADTLLEEQS